MLSARQLLQALEATIASHSFLTLRCLELVQQQALSTESAYRGDEKRRLRGLVGANLDD